MTDMTPLEGAPTEPASTEPASQPATPTPFGASAYDNGPYQAAPVPAPGPVPDPEPFSTPAAGPDPLGAWVPFDATAHAQQTQPAAPAVEPAVAPAKANKSHAGRTVALVAVAALVAAGVGGGVGAAVANAHDTPATASNLQTSLNASAAKVNLPAGSIESVAAKMLPSVVSIVERSSDGSGGEGSGIILSSDGVILTNNHVVTDSQNGGTLRVTTQDGKTVNATIVGTDPSSDLAVIKAQGVSGLTPATLGSSANLVVGQTVVAVGSPLGLSGTVTSGIVSALNRPVTTSDSSSGSGSSGSGGSGGTSSTASTGAVLNAIQTDAAINPGNSGGPLVDLNGNVVGIDSAIASLGAAQGSTQSGSIGLGFAIPIDQAKRIADELIKTGHATHPQLGVSVSDNADGGALVGDVTSGGAADKAGIKSGDVITAVNGHVVDSADALVADIRSSAPGSTVSVSYTRGGQTTTVSVKLGEATS
jgi:putative serine protease PepD